ncbi:MAG TPA: oxygen-dependent coproporphyrinogen oxidase [Dinghuibacter sp.]|uniref:oxygen-dependent coproporphyrinogen oxidase n=1 Tax=Dinghuibacter sp. TaxID=2024697 RepID=UPI002C18DDC6|nr:oxygen-dependent coproporphyrinogen oxidase [Dinghuibacter sp.]HTJ12717.1 oxygen-dependent coproporphyrinogen oxidase [Dinghuibacter sp.]
MESVKDRFITHIHALQDRICAALEAIEAATTTGPAGAAAASPVGGARFREDRWERPGGGGGISRVIEGGAVFEKGGVNTSVVFGDLPEVMQQHLKVSHNRFMATGLSLVIHPLNPYVPTVHANWRYFELYDTDGRVADAWFGGGADLTPYYIFPGDGEHFHRTLKEAMDPFSTEYYPLFKKHCDEYFINKHRGDEARGIGGVFYDYLRDTAAPGASAAPAASLETLLSFQIAGGNAFLPAYLPIVERRKDLTWGDKEQWWQEYRRGRYVEFNLVHDRGTLFGLKTAGRTESILMSLPPRARWAYDYRPEPGSAEALLVEYLKPRNWIP